MYVSDGFWHAGEVMAAPSITNRFATSHAWLCAFSTNVAGSRPMRAVPISWIVRPGGVISSSMVMSRPPPASSISAACNAASRIMARSFSLQAQLIRSAGIPHLSTCSGSRATWFSSRGRHSPKPVIPKDQGPGRMSSCLKSAPNPAIDMPRPQPARDAEPW